MSNAEPFDAQRLEQGLGNKFDDALLGVHLAQNELASFRQGQNRGGAPTGDMQPGLSKDQQLLDHHQRVVGLGGAGSDALQAYIDNAREDLQAHFQSAGQLEGGDTDIVSHRSLAEQGQPTQLGAQPGGELPPYSMLRGIPQGEGGQDFVRDVSAMEQEWASEEGDAI